jgi:hypothetical protein
MHEPTAKGFNLPWHVQCPNFIDTELSFSTSTGLWKLTAWPDPERGPDVYYGKITLAEEEA